MERYWMAKKALLNIPVIEGALPPDTFTQVVLYADAQRALDAEREKVKRLKKRLAEEHPGLDEVCDERDALRAQLRQVEGERDVLKRDQFATHACAKTFEQMSDESSLRRLLASLQADHARVLGLVQALPKCEGELEIAPFGGYHGISWYTGNGSCVTMGRFRSAEEAYAYKAMLAYRASLPA